MAPIDPDQLLKALDSLLSVNGGIRSMEDVPRLVSLMKKFSKKLVSRCVYCNVLQSTESDILAEYLNKGGWETINMWLQYAKSSSSPSFLIEMLKLCKKLPMTLERLKENNTAKLVKSMTKHDNSEVGDLSTELVTDWMVIIKGTKIAEAPVADKKKKKEKIKEKTKEKSENEKKDVKSSKDTKPEEEQKSPARLKGTKRMSSEKETKKTDLYEDVKLDPGPLMPVSKKPKTDRPKTAKIFQKKFRATGLEEVTPLPKKVVKKGGSVLDKSAAVAAMKNTLKINAPPPAERITEKKIKPETLMNIPETSPGNKGIKLIPAKPKPAYILQESASFMDALTSHPVAPVKRKKKLPPNSKVTSPTSPTLAPPKLQFYKDTLEMKEEEEKKKEEEARAAQEKEETPMEVDTDPPASDQQADITEDARSNTPTNMEEVEDSVTVTQDVSPSDKQPRIRSILSHGRRKAKRNIRFADEEHIREIFYFELDETERVNVNKTQNFGDMKFIEQRREREALEMAKRQAGDKMEERARWWTFPILIDVPPPLIELGWQSTEKEQERIRQETTLQEIYFTREMIPDSPHEPDLEIIPPQEPKVIPLDEENAVGTLIDHSSFEFPKQPPIADVISSLMKNYPVVTTSLANNFPEMSLENNLLKSIAQNGDMMNHSAPYDPAEPVGNLTPNLLPPQLPPNMFPHDPNNIPPNMLMGDWRPPLNMDGNMPPDQQQQFQFPPQGNWGPGGMMGPGMMGPGGPPMEGPMRPRMPGEMFRPNMHNSGGRGGFRPRHIHKVPCRHFAMGSCRFGFKCTFLHAGVNGPPLH